MNASNSDSEEVSHFFTDDCSALAHHNFLNFVHSELSNMSRNSVVGNNKRSYMDIWLERKGTSLENKRLKEDKSGPGFTPFDYETDPRILQRRQKQIDYGKNTDAYKNYIMKIPKGERLPSFPKTPEKYEKI